MGTVVDETYAAHAVTTRAARCIRGARVDTDGVHAHLGGSATAVVIASAGNGGNIDADVVAAGLARGAGRYVASDGACAVQADAT